jgi:choline dehydrogenase-like flavoprotein
MESVGSDVLIVGSGFDACVAAVGVAETGYRVGVMESGRRWKDGDISGSQCLGAFSGSAAELYGIGWRQRSLTFWTSSAAPGLTGAPSPADQNHQRRRSMP